MPYYENMARPGTRIGNAGRLAIAWMLLAPQAPGQLYSFIAHPFPKEIEDATTIKEDADGALWLGSTSGLYRFDGSRFQKFAYSSATASPTVYELASTPDGSVWVASKSGAYRVIGGKSTMLASGFMSAIAASPRAVAIVESDKNNPGARISALWIGFVEQGSWQLVRHENVPVNRQVSFAPDGALLLPCGDDLCEVAESDLRAPAGRLRLQRTAIATPEGGWHRAVRDSQGCIWLRNAAYMSYRCPGAKGFQRVPPDVADYHLMSPIFLDRQNRVWIVNERGSISFGRPGRFTIARRDNDAPRNIFAMEQTRDGTIWLAGSGGLWHWAHPGNLEYWTERQGLTAPYSVLRTRDGRTFATGSGLFALSADRTSWKPFGDLPAYRYATHALETNNGNLLVALWRDGIAELDRSGRTVRKSEPFSAMRLALDREGIWVNGAGLNWATTLPNGKFQITRGNTREPFSNGLDLQVDAKGNLWHCTGAGLFRRNSDASNPFSWTRWSIAEGLLEDGCRSMAVSPDGKRAWYGYNQTEAFTRLDFAENGAATVHHFRREDGFGGGYYLDYGSNGWLWRGFDFHYVSSGQASSSQDDWIQLSRSDGFVFEGSNQQGFSQDPDGSVWLSADDTLYHFAPPGDLFSKAVTPSVFIANDLSANRIDAGSPMELRFGSLQYQFRNRLRFRYRLRPEDRWEVTREPGATISNLSAGQYRLELSARMAPNGEWTPPVRWEFTVNRPKWHLPAVYSAIAAFLVAGGIFLRMFYRKRTYWRQKREFLKALNQGVTPTESDVSRLVEMARHSQGFPNPSPAWNAEPVSVPERRIVGSRFEILDAVARGGFAEVFLARDLEQDNHLAAVKIFHLDERERAWLLRRFEQEVEALRRIRSPYVVPFLAAGETSAGEPFLAMEYVSGVTVRQRLRHGALPLPECARIARQLGEALAAVHAAGVVHRDIKPENLMLTADGGELRLIDFSIAVAKDPRAIAPSLSRAAGSMLYMAPEQAFGYGSRGTDIYSFALVVAELILGASAGELGLGAATGQLGPDVESAILALHPQLQSAPLLRSALALDVTTRPDDAKEFGDQIARWLAPR